MHQYFAVKIKNYYNNEFLTFNLLFFGGEMFHIFPWDWWLQSSLCTRDMNNNKATLLKLMQLRLFKAGAYLKRSDGKHLLLDAHQ